ncbi:MAG: YjfB family protein [Sarcina sp.]
MNVAKMSIEMSQNSLKGAVSISLLKMAMNNEKQVANGMNQILRATTAKDPNLGNKIDFKA